MSELSPFGSSAPVRGAMPHRLQELANELLDIAQEGTSSRAKLGVILPFGHPERAHFIEAARETQRQRRLRYRFIRKDYFGEAAWEILLYLYVEEDVRRVSVTTVAAETEIALTTALRWISQLEQSGRVFCSADPVDGRVRQLRLTDKAKQEMDGLFCELLKHKVL
jgi:DNA-binding MarR family transcriptional regulator